MSKKVGAEITCPNCSTKFAVELYRSIWIEHPTNRKLIFNDEINVVTCPSCSISTKLEFPFLCTNVQKNIAVWYEPYPDPAIDKDTEQYSAHFGPNSFYARAPRISDWQEFKAKIIEMEGRKHAPGNVNISPEMQANMAGFMEHIKTANKPIQKRRTQRGCLAMMFCLALTIILISLLSG